MLAFKLYWGESEVLTLSAFRDFLMQFGTAILRGYHMHWRTFERLKAEHDVLVGESLAGMAKRFGLLDRFMD